MLVPFGESLTLNLKKSVPRCFCYFGVRGTGDAAPCCLSCASDTQR